MEIFDSTVTESEEPFSALGQASQFFHQDGHPPTVVPSDAALMALQEVCQVGEDNNNTAKTAQTGSSFISR